MSASGEKITKFLDEINKKFKKKYGGDVIYLGTEVQDFQPAKTGFPTIDWVNSGIGGFPRGGMTLIHGAESTGKSTLVLESMAFAMEDDPNFHAMYIDVEGSLTKTFFNFKKIEKSRVTVTRLNTEDALFVAEEALKSNLYDEICLDSLAKFESEKVLEKDMGESVQRGSRAKMLSEFFRRSTFILRNSKTALICINQEIENQDRKTPYEPKTIIPCGKAQKFAANLRLELKRSKAIKNGDVKLGYQVSITSIKNKISDKEKAVTNLNYIYSRGFMREMSLVEYLLIIGYIKKLPMGRFEFERKELYPNPFKAVEILKVAEIIKSSHELDLFSIIPDATIQYDKNENAGDIPARDELTESKEELETELTLDES